MSDFSNSNSNSNFQNDTQDFVRDQCGIDATDAGSIFKKSIPVILSGEGVLLTKAGSIYRSFHSKLFSNFKFSNSDFQNST